MIKRIVVASLVSVLLIVTPVFANPSTDPTATATATNTNTINSTANGGAGGSVNLGNNNAGSINYGNQSSLSPVSNSNSVANSSATGGNASATGGNASATIQKGAVQNTIDNKNMNTNVNLNSNSNKNTNVNKNTNKNTNVNNIRNSNSQKQGQVQGQGQGQSQSVSNNAAQTISPSQSTAINQPRQLLAAPEINPYYLVPLQGGRIGDVTASMPRFADPALVRLSPNDVVVGVLDVYFGNPFSRITYDEVESYLIKKAAKYSEGEAKYGTKKKIRYSVKFQDSVITSGLGGGGAISNSASDGITSTTGSVLPGVTKSTANPIFIITFYEVK